MEIKKGFTVEIIKSRFHAENGGISEKSNEVTIMGNEVPAMYEPTENAPAVKLVRLVLFGMPYMHVEPIDPPSKGHVGWMNGGAWIYSSDSRFPSPYPIPLHDRQEVSG